jgi:uncharacterized protein YuzE
MKITHDRHANALYIKLCDGVFARNHIVNSNVILDIDENGIVMGVELLDASEWITDPSRVEMVDITTPQTDWLQKVEG